jgi:DNA-3-methyladenine glycosylase II
MTATDTMTTFTVRPDTPFSLAASSAFGFGPNTGRPTPVNGEMRLAFVTDDMRHHAAVRLTQDDSAIVHAEVDSAADIDAVRDQVCRILCLDQPAAPWLAIGDQDPVLGGLQREHVGFRPVLFHSPYEAAAWSVLSARRQRTQASALRTRLSCAAGHTFTVAGEQVHAFPSPRQLLAVTEFPGIEPQRMRRLHAVADAAIDGHLEPAPLLAMAPADALAHLQKLPGIGPMYATLILLRATGATDVVTTTEPRLASYVTHFYGMATPPSAARMAAIAQPWRPYRTWACVLIRVAGDRRGLPFTEHRRSR